MASPVVNAENVVCSLGSEKAGPFSLKIYAGEIWALMGMPESGFMAAGAALSALLPVKSGKLDICGRPLYSREGRQLLGFVPGDPALYRELTCGEYLNIFAREAGLERHYGPYMIREALSLVRLGNAFDVPLSSIKDSLRQKKIGLARALLHNPRFLVIDGSFLSDNLTTRNAFIDILKDIRDTGASIALILEYLEGMQGLCSDICFFSDGVPVIQGKIADVAQVIEDTRVYGLKTVSIDDADIVAKGLLADDRVSSVMSSLTDPTFMRFVFRGPWQEADKLLASFKIKHARIVSCAEESRIFGKYVPLV